MTAIEPSVFWDFLKSRGINFVSGVPDSTFKKTYDFMIEDHDIRFVPAVREDVALGLASAAYFQGKVGAVIMQNSGIGNVVNPLTSFNLMYGISALMIIGWRGFGGPPNDAPEHWVMGTKSPEILETLNIPFEVLEVEGFENQIDQLLESMKEKSIPGALLVRSGVLL
ncbi:MAG: sulfopyruvate decarboxylase subunit alpha [Chloroflexi bacterium]|nr:sulfopyruvate decarboxylase subunit alpha [Chloroflexota bacterium]